MEAPKYLNSLERVARAHGGLSDMAALGEALTIAWTHLETNAKLYTYDILSDHYDCGYLVSLIQLLYRAPDTDWRKDCGTLRTKDKEYGGSWHRRGGPGAFMMLARKWDRIATAIDKYGDLGALIAKDQREEGVIDDITDLRCYLLLVLAWHQERREPTPEPTQLELSPEMDNPF
jgi:hypothetical protein